MRQISAEQLSEKLPELMRNPPPAEDILIEFEGKVIGTLALHSESESPVRREPGFAKGRFWTAEDFDEPLEEFKPYT